MFILTEKNQAAAVRQALRQRLKDTGVTVAHPGGEVLVLEGETFRLDGESLRLLPGVRAVQRLTEPYPLAARTGHPEDTVVSVGKARIGRDFCLIAGPCAVESSEQVTSIARQVSAAEAQLLRGGAFKPRTSPYTFGGLGAEGLELLCRAGRETGLPVVSEIDRSPAATAVPGGRCPAGGGTEYAELRAAAGAGTAGEAGAAEAQLRGHRDGAIAGGGIHPCWRQ